MRKDYATTVNEIRDYLAEIEEYLPKEWVLKFGKHDDFKLLIKEITDAWQNSFSYNQKW